MADVPETRELEPGGGEAADGSRLDSDSNKSPCEILFVPNRAGGRLHPRTGAGLRNLDIQKLCVIADAMKRPHLLTLTVDRDNWVSPPDALDVISKQFSRLVTERLGCSLWFRVYELQTKTGEGWPHVHALIDVKGRLSTVRETCWKFWREKWGIGGVDLKKARAAKGAATYLAKYLSKGMDAYPTWLLERYRAPRLVGYSKSAGLLLRASGLSVESKEKEGPEEKKRKRLRKKPVGQRLAESGKTVAVIQQVNGRNLYLGTLAIDPQTLACAHRQLPHCRLEKDEYGRTVVRANDWTPATIRYVNTWLRDHGYTSMVEADIRREEQRWRHSWDYMQAVEGGDGEA